nr:beta-hexosaminidase 3-like isoform X1 [Coffea arabica]
MRIENAVMGRKGILQKIFLGILVVHLLVIAVAAGYNKGLKIWPMPVSVSHGRGTLYLRNDLELRIDGRMYSDASGIFKDGFFRFLEILKGDHVFQTNISSFNSSLIIKGIHVVIVSPSDELQHGVDESYKLSVPMLGDPSYAYIEAKTVYGALHALETFSQVCYFNHSSRVIEIHQAPWIIFDEPRFSYRGLLIDTSRHFLPVPVIKKVIDSMTFAKLNVLHWHIVDEESFPLEIPSYPKLWNGAYSSSERYSMAQAAEIVRYAQRRGIHVLAEIDAPAHAKSWGIGYPSLWPSINCTQPLDVSNDFTFNVIDGILSDISKIFKYRFVHLGGDEVNTSCWTSTPHVSNWLKEQGLNGDEAYQYFVLKAQEIALSYGYKIVNWEETFVNFGSKLSRETVIHHWLRGGVVQKAVAAGFQCIVSNQESWYLDNVGTTWKTFYANEPLFNIRKPQQKALVMGGEVCMWGERVDGSDIEQTIWPRAAAAAERLWTPYDKVAKDTTEVTERLAHFRCLLNQRGVAAAPLTGWGRAAPMEPGSCYKQ